MSLTGVPTTMELESLRAMIVAAMPELAGGAFTMITAGWDSVAVDVDDRLIFKFPRDPDAERDLRVEASLLDVVRPVVDMPVPAMTLFERPRLFSVHAKIPGEHLVTAQYERLPDAARGRLAAGMARFFAQLHALGTERMAAAGAKPIHAWTPPDETLRRVEAVLPPALRTYAARTLDAWARLEPDPHGLVYGFFDGHGWNMAFDHARQRLNGIYDFGDSGIGALHLEFVPPAWVSPDLAARIVDEYERLTGRMIDRARVRLLSGALRLCELAQFADDPDLGPAMLRNVAAWAAHEPPA